VSFDFRIITCRAEIKVQLITKSILILLNIYLIYHNFKIFFHHNYGYIFSPIVHLLVLEYYSPHNIGVVQFDGGINL